jgi:acetamidase/formamidase
MRLALMLALACAAVAETRDVRAERYYNSFDHRHAVLARIKPGDTVRTFTIDAGGYDENGKQAGERSNPLTGPFYIEGAEPGDAIAVRFDRVRMNRDYGWTGYRLVLQSLNEGMIERIYPRTFRSGAALPGRDDLVKWSIDLSTSKVRLVEPRSAAHAMEFTAKPMLGCVGVAAPGVFAPTSGISGPYGGNMDYNRIGEGSTLVLPVFHPGALFFLGDGHALQADGEPLGTGIETTMEVTFTIALRKKANLAGPRLETAEFIASIGSQPEFASSLDRSLRLATSDMVEWLVKDYGMEPWAAHLLIGNAGQYDVITVQGSMALRLPRSALPERKEK